MKPILNMVEDRKHIWKVFQYCRRHGVVFTARCEELVPVELNLKLLDIRRIQVPFRISFQERTERWVSLLMSTESNCSHSPLSWSFQNYTFSFHHRTLNHSFHSQLLKFIKRSGQAVFSFPSWIYSARIREAMRVSVGITDRVMIAWDDCRMNVFDLAMDGVGLLLPDSCRVRVGQVIPALSLVLQEDRFPAVGKIRHISRIAGKRICGMSMVYRTPEAATRIGEFIVAKQLASAGILLSNTGE